MTEPQRAKEIEAIQLRLFELTAQVKEIKQERVRLKRMKARIVMQGVKRCRKCRDEMDADQFYPAERMRDGLDSYCIECRSTANRARYHERKRAA